MKNAEVPFEEFRDAVGDRTVVDFAYLADIARARRIARWSWDDLDHVLAEDEDAADVLAFAGALLSSPQGGFCVRAYPCGAGLFDIRLMSAQSFLADADGKEIPPSCEYSTLQNFVLDDFADWDEVCSVELGKTEEYEDIEMDVLEGKGTSPAHEEVRNELIRALAIRDHILAIKYGEK